MPYRPYRSDRSRRLRRWLLIILTAAAVIAIIAYLVSRDTEQRTSTEFFAAADESGRLHSEAADDLEGVLAAIGVVSRSDFESRLDDMVEAAERADSLLDVDIVPPIAEPFGAMTTASTAWVRGVGELRSVFTDLLNGGGDQGSTARIRAAMDLLRSGDVAHENFVSLSRNPDFDLGAATIEGVRYVRTGEVQDPVLYDPLTIAVRIGSSYNLAPHRDVGVTGQFAPEPVGDRAGIPLLPFSETVTLSAIVTNIGNEDETAVTVEMQLINSDADVTETRTESVSDLPAGASSTVNFAGLTLEPGRLYQVKLTVTIAEDTQPDNNVWLQTIIQNEES